MGFDAKIAFAGLIVGFVVGLTGMGGGALMTPILVILFKVQPLAAVSSDLVASFVMKPVGGLVHWRRGTVQWPLALWLMAGSIPAAFTGVVLLRLLGNGQNVENIVQLALGAALLLSAALIVVKAGATALAGRRGAGAVGVTDVRVRPLATVAVGAAGGLIVGMTSVGSGSLIIVCLLFLYPRLQTSRLIGTDLVQAIPLVGSAALGHVLFGDFRLDLTTSLLAGALPGVFAGARISAVAPSEPVRWVLAFVLLLSGLRLVDASTTQLGVAMLAGAVAGTAALVIARVRARDRRRPPQIGVSTAA